MLLISSLMVLITLLIINVLSGILDKLSAIRKTKPRRLSRGFFFCFTALTSPAKFRNTARDTLSGYPKSYPIFRVGNLLGNHINGVRTPKNASGYPVTQVTQFFIRILGKKKYTKKIVCILFFPIGDLSIFG